MLRLTRTNSKSLLTHAVLFAVVAFCIFVFIVSLASVAHAQPTDFEQFGAASGLPTNDIAILVARIIRQALMVVGIIFTVLIIYAGYLYLLARGAPEPIKKAQSIFKTSIIGLIIIFSAYGIASFILSRLLDAAFTGSLEAIAQQYSEPLSGSLGSGIIDDHYPQRDAIDIPRNTRIFVTFDEPINPATMIEGYDDDPTATGLDVGSVKIYPTATGASTALASNRVVVTHNETFETFVFDPVEYLGNADTDTNYTVVLTPDIEKADGSDAFFGAYSGGYEWTFEVSTEIDLTPPYVVSVVPAHSSTHPRNVTIEVNFSEAMDPVASTGTYDLASSELFTNIEALNASGVNIDGIWEISNAYRTVGFTTTDACGEDPCGDTIYCLPGDEVVSAVAHAAKLNTAEIPQALPITGIDFDGLVDAAGNSLDGDNSGDVCGSDADTVVCEDGDSNDDYDWSFTTTDEIEDTVPQVVSIDPGISEGNVSTVDDLIVTFNTFLKSSTLGTNSVSLWPDPWYEMWFAIRKDQVYALPLPTPPALPVATADRVRIEHPTLVSDELGGWDYWPVLTQEIKSNYQICMYPAIGPNSCGDPATSARLSTFPYCCEGIPSNTACETDSGDELPDNTPP